ncbi:MAG: DUF4920 domain-containing protein [Planctomycetes bacterium]|nr:DUF4920 domain-containing protein [Planctomycetota bacterium]
MVGHRRYGAELSVGDAVPARALLQQPESYDGKRVLVEGTVAEVCPVKGCWMVIRDGEQSMRVTFKDYGFFVPKDCAGQTARIEGVFAICEVPVDEARHYLEDAGRPEGAAKITQPVKQLTLVADGVELPLE